LLVFDARRYHLTWLRNVKEYLKYLCGMFVGFEGCR
jgi:hypothetical protein